MSGIVFFNGFITGFLFSIMMMAYISSNKDNFK